MQAPAHGTPPQRPRATVIDHARYEVRSIGAALRLHAEVYRCDSLSLVFARASYFVPTYSIECHRSRHDAEVPSILVQSQLGGVGIQPR